MDFKEALALYSEKYARQLEKYARPFISSCHINWIKELTHSPLDYLMGSCICYFPCTSFLPRQWGVYQEVCKKAPLFEVMITCCLQKLLEQQVPLPTDCSCVSLDTL